MVVCVNPRAEDYDETLVSKKRKRKKKKTRMPQ